MSHAGGERSELGGNTGNRKKGGFKAMSGDDPQQLVKTTAVRNGDVQGESRVPVNGNSLHQCGMNSVPRTSWKPARGVYASS